MVFFSCAPGQKRGTGYNCILDESELKPFKVIFNHLAQNQSILIIPQMNSFFFGSLGSMSICIWVEVW